MERIKKWLKQLFRKEMRVCPSCGGKKRFRLGTGKHSTVYRPCPVCKGVGEVPKE